MRTRRLAEIGLILAAVALALGVGAEHQPVSAAPTARAVSWQGLVGDGPREPVDVGRQMIVVLKTPSLAQRVAAAGGTATSAQEQRWTATVLAQERLLRARLQVQGVLIRPDFNYTRVLAGFSAQLDATAVALLERDDAVQGVYPVRVAYPASTSSAALEHESLASSVGNADLSLPGYDGRGVTIALLDTGVDRAHPALLGSFAPGIDVLDPNGDASPQAEPGRPTEVERHGTELAGILVGTRGPAVAHGVAPGASVQPIRVAGWQPDGKGGYAVFARTDQLIEGLERAVDPNADGDAHDAARVALIGLAAPYAGFADDPTARAVAGALDLDTLVVAPAGNDGPAGPGFGSISSPGGAPESLTVGAADLRRTTQHARVALRAGLQVVLDRTLPLTGAAPVARAFTSPVAAPILARRHASFDSAGSYFTKSGLSLVAGRAALVAAGADPVETARAAARAGATAVLLYGSALPPGGLPLDEETPVPVAWIPAGTATRLLAAIASGRDAGASIGASDAQPDLAAPLVAPFSSTGLAYDGRVKPDVVASGVAIAVPEPGLAADGTARYATLNGSSAAAAAVAGAAAVLAEARPSLDARALRSAIVGSARRVPAEAVSSQGAGLAATTRAAAAQLVTEPTTLSFGNARRVGWHRWQNIVVRNLSNRRLPVRIRAVWYAQGAAPVLLQAAPDRFTLAPGGRRVIAVLAIVAKSFVGTTPAEGSIVLAPAGAQPVRLPWVVTFVEPPGSVLGALRLSTTAFKPSDTAPALLTFRAGRLVPEADRIAVEPLALLRLDLVRAADGHDLGTLATLRDLLPGQYAFGLTGRSSAGNRLHPGRYRLRVTAVPTLPGPPSVAEAAFTIQ